MTGRNRPIHPADADKGWADQYEDLLIEIVAKHCGGGEIQRTSLYDDRNYNIDLKIMQTDAGAVSIRVRRFDQLKPGREDEITMRSYRPTGAETEFGKILAGLGDWSVYGFVAPVERKLALWHVLDLRKFRAYCQAYRAERGDWPGVEISNRDGTRFRIFNVRKLPSGVHVAEYRDPLLIPAPPADLWAGF